MSEHRFADLLTQMVDPRTSDSTRVELIGGMSPEEQEEALTALALFGAGAVEEMAARLGVSTDMTMRRVRRRFRAHVINSKEDSRD